MAYTQDSEKKFKKGEVIYRAGTFDLTMYNIMYGQVGIYIDYGEPTERKVLEMGEGDFFNVISFLESRPRNTTVVALCPTIVHEISFDNFGDYFVKQPAKIMSLMQHMSARMRVLQAAYLDACEELDACRSAAQLPESGEKKAEQDRLQHLLRAVFGSSLG